MRHLQTLLLAAMSSATLPAVAVTPGQAVAPESAASECVLRFDGLYASATGDYFRFWPDGRARTESTISVEAAARYLRFPRSGGDTPGRGEAMYRVKGCELALEWGSTKQINKGTIVGRDSIRFVSSSFGADTYTYQFIPVDFDVLAKIHPSVRSDGVYRFAMFSNPLDPANPFYLYVRFFEDSSAMDVITADGPQDVLRWLTRKADAGIPGSYHLSGNVLTFIRPTATGSITRTGTLVDDVWILQSDSPNPARYHFVPAQASEGAAAEMNRAPIVKATLIVDHVHMFDGRGRRAAVNTTVQVDAHDPDGDPLTLVWRANNGSIVGTGSKVAWLNRPVTSYGAVEEGVLFLEVHDDKGAKTTRAWIMR